jgi:orotidine-5'-phosphate decarboxylase
MVDTAIARPHGHNRTHSAREKLIVALDVSSVSRAHEIIDRLGDIVSFYKIGLHLQFERHLHSLFDRLLSENKRVFVDFKAFDIPASVEAAVGMASTLGISFVTVVGQQPIVEAAVRGRGNSGLKILVVTLLTGMNEEDMRREYHTTLSLEDFISRRARYAARIGCDGVISSAREATLIRNDVDRRDFLVVTPGIRLPGTPRDDQKRVVTPHDAILNGADYLVVGRPIIHNPRPEEAALRIIEDMESALEQRPAFGT